MFCFSSSGYPSVRHSLLRMHSQLRSAQNRRESNNQGGPIDLSLYRVSSTPSSSSSKMTTRSTSTATATSTMLRSIPIVAPIATTPTQTIYSNAIPSSSSFSMNLDQPMQSTYKKIFSSSLLLSYLLVAQTFTRNDTQQRSSSPKLAYSYTNIEENLQCPLCIDRLRDPRALPCQHVFCCSCLKSMPLSNLPHSTIACPLCRQTFPYISADRFPISYIHRQLLELIPKNYDINGKCTKCEEKCSLTLCSCCDFLLCQKCYSNDRQKILDNIEHITSICRFRLTRIDSAHNQLVELNENNRKKIQQVQSTYENFEKKYTEYKDSILNNLYKHNENIKQTFWSKLNMPTPNATESFLQLLNQADSVIKKSQTMQFDDIISMFCKLTSVNEQLEQANTSIDTYDVQNLLKRNIEINCDEQMSVQFNHIDNQEKILPLIPTYLLPKTTKRQRKTEPKRHVEEVENGEDLPVLKKLKIKFENETCNDEIQSPTSSILCVNLSSTNQQTDNDDDDDDIIFVGSFQSKSPSSPNFEELFQIINTNE